MKVMAQLGMVMNLDKCIGCHTCSVTCKQAWTNRTGVEYVWFNNVETRPGLGYPRTHEDQERWRGGWERTKRGALRLKGGGRWKKLASIFSNPKLPSLSDYYEPWTYEYDTLISAPLGEHTPVARPKSLITGQPMKIEWSANWDDDLGGGPEVIASDPVLVKIREQVSERVALDFERAFMFYLPRICEHCLNPSCVASCPSGAMYKRAEDGIVLVDQDRCRGWRMCVSGCPYKKVYFNHKTGKAEKCTFCYPRVEVGMPTVCSETCVGRLRYIGLFLYDADRVLDAASVEDDKDLYRAQLELILDPHDPEVIAAAERDGIAPDWVAAAQKSPVYRLAKEFEIALPLHPEYRTMPMVWYIPPLSPVVDALTETGNDGEDARNLFGAIDALRIPKEYLAELFTAGDTQVIDRVLRRLAAMRSTMRDVNLGREVDTGSAEAVGLDEETVLEMYRLLAIAKYEERYVIPAAHTEQAQQLEETGCSLDFEEGPGMYGSGPFGEASGVPVPVAVENFHALKVRQTSDAVLDTTSRQSRINLLNWDGKGAPTGLFPTQGQGPMSYSPQDLQRVRQLCSLFLRYPDESLVNLLTPAGDMVSDLPAGSSDPLTRFLEYVEHNHVLTVQQHYVETFDMRRKCSPYLTYWTFGDTRNRGMALLHFKDVYRIEGLTIDESELPDHISVVLEFAAQSRLGEDLLGEHRAVLELLHEALSQAGSPYRHVLTAVLASTPPLSAEGERRMHEIARDGPPTETVGVAGPLDITLTPYGVGDSPLMGGRR